MQVLTERRNPPQGIDSTSFQRLVDAVKRDEYCRLMGFGSFVLFSPNHHNYRQNRHSEKLIDGDCHAQRVQEIKKKQIPQEKTCMMWQIEFLSFVLPVFGKRRHFLGPNLSQQLEITNNNNGISHVTCFVTSG